MHHTKHKGDIGLTTVIADLVKQDWIVCLPIQEHAPYDLIVTQGSKVRRIQVKYRDSSVTGVMEVWMRNSWGNLKRRTVRGKLYTPEEIDCFAVTNGINTAYGYVCSVNNLESFRIRVNEPKGTCGKDFRMIEDFKTLV